MIKKLRDATRDFRAVFGALSGSWLWLQLLKEKLHQQGGLFSVSVPGVKHPIWLRAGTSDVEVFCQIFVRRELGFFNSSEAKYIIDAGANIGLTSVFLANCCPNAKIDALEVEPDNLRVMQLNCAPYPNIQVVAKGLWHGVAHIKIANPSAESWAFFVHETTEDDPAAIAAVGVQQLMEQRKQAAIDFLKVDIEGSEVELFSGDNKPWLDAVKVLAVELHDRFRPGCSAALAEAVSGRDAVRSQHGEYHVFQFGAAAPA